MTTEASKLFQKKGELVEKLKDVGRELKEGKQLTAEQEKEFDAWDSELKQVTANIARLERAEALEKELDSKRGEAKKGDGSQGEVEKFSNEHKRTIYKVAKTKGLETLTEGERSEFKTMEIEAKAFAKWFKGAEMNSEEKGVMNTLAQRAQSVGTTTAGGFLVPQGFIATVDEKLKLISPFFSENIQGLTASNIFTFLRTDKGNDLPMPTEDDTAVVGELLAENSDAFANTADKTFGQVTFKAYKYNSKPMKVSNELLNDSGVDIVDLIARNLATRIARIANTHFTTGDNSSKPQGIVTGATAGKTTAASAAITFPEIIDLEHSVDAAYRKSASCRFMFHDLVLAYLKKLTIGSATNDSRPVWQPGFAFGAPDTIDGYQYLINNDMASTLATTNITMLFGDMSKYGIRQVNGYVVKRLDERFADFDQTAWLMFARMDGRYMNTAAIKKMTQV